MGEAEDYLTKKWEDYLKIVFTLSIVREVEMANPFSPKASGR